MTGKAKYLHLTMDLNSNISNLAALYKNLCANFVSPICLLMDTSLPLERLLQRMRFRKVLPYLKGEVVDFGGNHGELSKHVIGTYHNINRDHSTLHTLRADTIVMLAVLEHLDPATVTACFHTFKAILRPGGRLIITTPTHIAKPILDTLAFLHLLDPENIAEHKHYWNAVEMHTLAQASGFTVTHYNTFQLGFNQLAVFEHA